MCIRDSRNGTWQLIDTVPTNEIENLKKNNPDEFKVVGQLGTYYTCWNINEAILPADSTLTGAEAETAKAEIRKAITLLFDRNYIVEKIAQGGQLPASSFVAMGMTNPDGTEFYETAGHNDEFVGYYNVSADAFADNFNSAIETLKKYYNYDGEKFTNFPTLTYLYNTDENHKAVGEYLQSALAAVGITINLENQEWNTFLNTRKNGDYSIARNGWLADYNLSLIHILFTESYLSFLGLGVNAPMPSLGSLASDALNGITSYPYRLVIPAIVISLIVLSLNLFGDGLRDA